jgi:hypothetical protein
LKLSLKKSPTGSDRKPYTMNLTPEERNLVSQELGGHLTILKQAAQEIERQKKNQETSGDPVLDGIHNMYKTQGVVAVDTGRGGQIILPIGYVEKAYPLVHNIALEWHETTMETTLEEVFNAE